MLARAHTFTIDGLQVRLVAVEVDIRAGLPAFTIIGLADAAVREARERVRAAILNSGYQFPARRITANLAPADVPKAGPGLNLALACAILAASGQTSGERLAIHALFGELALDGEIRPSRGALAVAMAAAQAGLARLVLARSQARRAALVQEIEVAPAASLTSALRILAGGAPDRAPAVGANRQAPPDADGAPAGPDLREVKGQHHAVQALILAAAGAHNLLLSGPPG